MLVPPPFSPSAPSYEALLVACLFAGCNSTWNMHAGHRFWYAKGMTTSEAFIFKCYDSRKTAARFVPHTAFKDPTTPPDAAPRQSIELRAYAFFEDLPEQAIEHEL